MSPLMIRLSDRYFRVKTYQIKKLWAKLQFGDILPIPETEARPHLVEALILGIPCAPALMHEDVDGKLTSVKNPTLEAVLAFIRGDFKIQYEGQTLSYLDLPLNTRDYFAGLSMQVVITDPACTQEVRKEVEVLMGRTEPQMTSTFTDPSTLTTLDAITTLADGFAAREAARDRGERNTQIVIGVDSSIYRELPEFEDDNGAIVPARRFLEVAGTPQMDLGREFRLPTSCLESILNVRKVLIMAKLYQG